jgi:hypothetical protein
MQTCNSIWDKRVFYPYNNNPIIMKSLYQLSTLVMTLLVLLGVSRASAQSQEYTMDGMTFGMPEGNTQWTV